MNLVYLLRCAPGGNPKLQRKFQFVELPGNWLPRFRLYPLDRTPPWVQNDMPGISASMLIDFPISASVCIRLTGSFGALPRVMAICRFSQNIASVDAAMTELYKVKTFNLSVAGAIGLLLFKHIRPEDNNDGG